MGCLNFEKYRTGLAQAASDQEKEQVFMALAAKMLSKRIRSEKTISEMMEMELVAASFKELSVTLRFPVRSWQINPIGTLHGGISGTAADETGGLLTQVTSMTGVTPTVYLNTSYLSPVKEGDALVVKARIERAGKRLVHVHCEGWAESTGEMAIAAMGAYMPIYK